MRKVRYVAVFTFGLKPGQLFSSFLQRCFTEVFVYINVSTFKFPSTFQNGFSVLETKEFGNDWTSFVRGYFTKAMSPFNFNIVR